MSSDKGESARKIIDGRSVEDMTAEHHARQQRRRLSRENKQLLEQNSLLNRRLEIALELKAHKSKSYKIPSSDKRKSEGVSFLNLSDVHVEENVDLDTTNGLNEYDVDIAAESLGSFFANGLRLHKICARDIPVPHMVLSLIGDMISGYIHEELMEKNALSPTQATLVLKDYLKSGIRYLLDKSDVERLTVICKWGNHGRTTQKKRIATGYMNSFEWMMYHDLAAMFKSEERVHFIIENGYLTYLTVFDKYDIRFHHGDAIGYQGGVGGVTIPANKAVAQWNKERPAHLDVFGHFHTMLLGGTPSQPFIINGSVIGYNPYGIYQKFAYEPPMQAFFLIDKERGITARWPIFVR